MDFILKILLVVGPCLSQSRVMSAPRQARLSVADSQPSYYHTNIDGVPGTYSFGYDVTDPTSGNHQFRTEERYPNGTVVGSYGYVDAAGKPYRFRYIADERGYRVMRIKPSTPPAATPPAVPLYQGEVTWTRKKKPNNNKMQSWTSGKGTQRKQASFPLDNSLYRPAYYSYS